MRKKLSLYQLSIAALQLGNAQLNARFRQFLLLIQSAASHGLDATIEDEQNRVTTIRKELIRFPVLFQTCLVRGVSKEVHDAWNAVLTHELIVTATSCSGPTLVVVRAVGALVPDARTLHALLGEYGAFVAPTPARSPSSLPPRPLFSMGLPTKAPSLPV